jgi:hypothetical protein
MVKRCLSSTEAYRELVAVDGEGTSAIVINGVTAYDKISAWCSNTKHFIPWHMKLGTL